MRGDIGIERYRQAYERDDSEPDSTAKSTSGKTGCVIAQAEMRLIARSRCLWHRPWRLSVQ